MPIGLEQWRAQIGALEAQRYRYLSRAARKAARRGQPRCGVSGRRMSCWVGIVVCVTLLGLALSCSLLLLRAGDIEKNPGPLPDEVLSAVDNSELAADDLNAVYKEVYTLAGRWRTMYLSLGLSPTERDAIVTSYPNNSHDCLQEALLKWLRKAYNFQQYGPPTWRMLVEAVADPTGGNDPALAEKIAKAHQAVPAEQSPEMDIPPAKQPKQNQSYGSSGPPRPTLHQLLRELGSYTDLDYLGLSLGIDEDAIASIKTEESEVKRRCWKMFSLWLKKAPTVSWENICKALDNNGSNTLAHSIREKYCHQQKRHRQKGCRHREEQAELIEAGQAEATHTNCTSTVASAHTQSTSPLTVCPAQREHPTPPCHKISVPECKEKMQELHRKFTDIITKTERVLKESGIDVNKFRTTIACLPITLPLPLRGECEKFIQVCSEEIANANSLGQLFVHLNRHWNFLNFGLLEYIIEEYGDENVKKEVKQYATEVQVFRRETTVRVFWEAIGHKPIAQDQEAIPPKFKKHIVECEWSPDSNTLEDVEKLRHDTACTLSLHDCAILVYEIRPNTVEITFLVPSFVLDNPECTYAVAFKVTTQTGEQHVHSQERQLKLDPADLRSAVPPEEDSPPPEEMKPNTEVLPHKELPLLILHADSSQQAESEKDPHVNELATIFPGQLQSTDATDEATLATKATQEQLTPPEKRDQAIQTKKEPSFLQILAQTSEEKRMFQATLEQRESQLDWERQRREEVEQQLEDKQRKLEELQLKIKELQNAGQLQSTDTTHEATLTTKATQEQLTPPEKRDQAIQTKKEPSFLQILAQTSEERHKFQATLEQRESQLDWERQRREEVEQQFKRKVDEMQLQIDELREREKLAGQLQSSQANEEATLTLKETQEQLSQPEKRDHKATQATGETTTTTKEMQEQLIPPEKGDKSAQTYTEPSTFLQTPGAAITVAELAKEASIDESDLDKPCLEEDLVTISKFLDWRVVTPYLNLSEPEIAEVEAEGKQEQEKRRKALQKWKGKCGFKATYRVLVEALLDSRQADDAEKVCRLLVPTPGTCTTLSNDDLPILCDFLPGVATKWMAIGLALGIPMEQLDAIKADPKLIEEESPLAYMEKTFSKWLRGKVQGVPPTIEALVEALQCPSVNEMKLASELKPHLIKQKASSNYRPRHLVKSHTTTKFSPQPIYETPHLSIKQVKEDHKGKQLWWQVCEKAPRPMYRGSSTSEGSKAYFRPAWSQSVFTFDAKEEKWSELPPYPNKVFSLVVVKGHVTGVGGKAENGATNALLSLTGEGRNARWAKYFPPMPTARWFTSPIFNGRHLIVAGGANSGGRFSTVEVMDTENDQWYTASSLPNPYDQLAASIVNEKLYLLGGMEGNGTTTRSVLVCSLSDLLKSCNPSLLRRTASQPEQQLQLLASQHHALTPDVVWHPVLNIPVYLSTCASLGGRLIAIGGYYTELHYRTSEVFTYSPDTNEWLVISHMPTARSFSMVVVLPRETVMVVGGNANSNPETDTVEMAIFV